MSTIDSGGGPKARPDWHVLIPALAGYFKPGPADPEDFAFYESSIEVALGFSNLFWPNFYLYEDMVFRDVAPEIDEVDAANIRSWLTQYDGDKSRVEAMLNHSHLIDLFRMRQRPGDDPQISYLATVIVEMWAAKLRQDFPDRSFEVELDRGAHETWNWEITFYQRR